MTGRRVYERFLRAGLAGALRSCAARTTGPRGSAPCPIRSEEHTSELQSQSKLVCRLLLEKKTEVVAEPVVAEPQHEVAAAAPPPEPVAQVLAPPTSPIEEPHQVDLPPPVEEAPAPAQELEDEAPELAAPATPSTAAGRFVLFTDPPSTEIYTLSLHDALPI